MFFRKLNNRALAVAIVFICGFSVATAQDESQPDKRTHSRAGSWSFSAHPFMGKGYESRPAVVTSVRTTAKTLTVTEVRVRSKSPKSISSIRLGWSISNGDPVGEIAVGESVLIPFKKSLAPGDTDLLQLPLLSFVEIKDELEKNRKLSGHFDAYIWVSQIYFDDNTRWKLGDKLPVESSK